MVIGSSFAGWVGRGQEVERRVLSEMLVAAGIQGTIFSLGVHVQRRNMY